jgi:hypothetical protein
MEITKNSRAGFGELSCLINATIEVFGLNIPQMEGGPNSSSINNALISFDMGYRSAFGIREQWEQFIDILERLISEERQKDDIEKLADEYFEKLQRNGHL